MDERRMGGRVLDWDRVALLDGRLLDERMMGGRVFDWDVEALLDGRLLDGEAGRADECWIGMWWRCWKGDRWMSERWRS
jgi:hypothetical protein